MIKSNSNARSPSLNRQEQLIVRWRTVGKTKGKGTGAFYKGIGGRESVDKITEWLGGGKGEDDSKEFTGLFIFEFDEEGNIWTCNSNGPSRHTERGYGSIIKLEILDDKLRLSSK